MVEEVTMNTPSVIDNFELTANELLEIRNYDLNKKLLQSERDNIALKEELWLVSVSKRVNTDAHLYTIDFGSGVCTIRPEIKSQLLAKSADSTTEGAPPRRGASVEDKLLAMVESNA
jgi:hypothetical protein